MRDLPGLSVPAGQGVRALPRAPRNRSGLGFARQRFRRRDVDGVSLTMLRCPNCGEPLAYTSRWWGLVKRYAGSCAHCGARIAFDTAGGVHLLVGKYSTEDPAEAAEVARREGVPWPPGAPKE